MAFRLVVVGLVEDDDLDENERPLVSFSCFVIFFLGSFASPDDEGCGAAAACSGRGGNPFAKMARRPCESVTGDGARSHLCVSRSGLPAR